MLTSATTAMPTSAWALGMTLTAPLLPLPPEDEPDPPDEDPLEVLLPEGADGTNVALGSDTQELAAALAAETVDGARGLTEPFPAKLQAWPSWLLSSYHSLMMNESFIARIWSTVGDDRKKRNKGMLTRVTSRETTVCPCLTVTSDIITVRAFLAN